MFLPNTTAVRTGGHAAPDRKWHATWASSVRIGLLADFSRFEAFEEIDNHLVVDHGPELPLDLRRTPHRRCPEPIVRACPSEDLPQLSVMQTFQTLFRTRQLSQSHHHDQRALHAVPQLTLAKSCHAVVSK
jgi:hypothetical protein